MSELRNNGQIQEIDYETAKAFAKQGKNLILKPDYTYRALVIGCNIVSILGYKEKDNCIKLHCNYTPDQLRGNGYFSTLLKETINSNCEKTFIADCLLASKNIYLKAGFELVSIKHYKSFDIFKVQKRGLS